MADQGRAGEGIHLEGEGMHPEERTEGGRAGRRILEEGIHPEGAGIEGGRGFHQT